MNDVKYNLILENGYVIKEKTESDIVAMFDENRLPPCYICYSDDPNNVYWIEDVIEVLCDKTDTYKTFSKLKGIVMNEQYGLMREVKDSCIIGVFIIVTCLILAAIGVPIISAIDSHFGF